MADTPGFPQDREKNAVQLEELRAEFPEVDANRVVGAFQCLAEDNQSICDGRPFLRGYNPHQALRDYFKTEQEYLHRDDPASNEQLYRLEQKIFAKYEAAEGYLDMWEEDTGYVFDDLTSKEADDLLRGLGE
jgi:hypothetical protein